jgi:hypothetical protein
MAKTTFSEEIYLRALTGKIVGSHVLSGYNKIAVVSVKNTICSALSAAAEAVYSAETGGKAAHFTVEKEKVKEAIENVSAFNPDAILLMFGGETPIEETKALFTETLQELAETNREFDIIVHVRIFAAGGLQEAIKSEEILAYLQNNNVTVYTVDFEKGELLYNDIYLPDADTIKLEKIAEVPLTVEHADLLNRSLRDKKVNWTDA